MKTRYIVVILGIIISSSIIFAIYFEPSFEQEHYDIEIFGLKDVYLVGEPYSLSYTISGYGYSCANREILYPDENGTTVRSSAIVQCMTGMPKTNFVIDSKDESEIQSISIKNPGRYGISIMFDKSPPTHIEPTQFFTAFYVVEKICDDSDPKEKSQCFAKSYESCESAYMTQQFTTENGGIVNLRAVVESWYDCTLRVYTENSLGEHAPFNDIRSICENMTVDENSLNFENCNNADYPPIMFTLQYPIPNLELSIGEKINFGESFTIHAWLATYENQNDLQYMVSVLDSEGNPVDSTIWFAKEDFIYLFDTTHPAYNITQSATYSIQIEKTEKLQRTGIIYKSLPLDIFYPTQDNQNEN